MSSSVKDHFLCNKMSWLGRGGRGRGSCYQFCRIRRVSSTSHQCWYGKTNGPQKSKCSTEWTNRKWAVKTTRRWVKGVTDLLTCENMLEWENKGLIKIFNIRPFIQKEKLYLEYSVAVPPETADAKHRDELLRVSDSPNWVDSEIQNWCCCIFTLCILLLCSSVSSCDFIML